MVRCRPLPAVANSCPAARRNRPRAWLGHHWHPQGPQVETMKILLANPNTSQNVTERIAEIARQAAAPGTEILAVTAKSGVPYIASRAEAAIAGGMTLEL